MTNNEISAFEDFKFKIGDIVLRVTDCNDDKGIVVGRELYETAAGTCRGYIVAFDSMVCNERFNEIELKPCQRPA